MGYERRFVRPENVKEMVCRLCNLPCHYSRGIRCGVNGVDDGFVDCAEDSNTAQPQAAGTGRHRLPSGRPGGSTEGSIRRRSEYVVRVSVEGFGAVGG